MRETGQRTAEGATTRAIRMACLWSGIVLLAASGSGAAQGTTNMPAFSIRERTSKPLFQAERPGRT